MCLVMQYVPTKTGHFPGDMPQCSIFQLKAVLTVPDGRAFCFCNGPKHTLTSSNHRLKKCVRVLVGWNSNF